MTVIKLELLGANLGEQDNNVFHYFHDVNYNPTELINLFVRDCLLPILDIKGTSYSAVGIKCSAPESNILPEVSATLVGYNGQRPSDPEPSFVQASFILRRSTTVVKSGGKRFGSIVQDSIEGNDATPGYLALLNNVAAILPTVWEVATSEYIWPIVYRYAKDDPPAPSLATVVGGASYTKISTMDKRKRGRGEPAASLVAPTFSITNGSFAPPAGKPPTTYDAVISGGVTPFYLDGTGGTLQKVNVVI